MEEAEKTKDSRLAREFVVALPIELDKSAWQELLSDFIQAQFVSDGMCADVAIHDTDGHNLHAHIMLTVRPLTETGAWQYKTEKEYLCVRNGEERGFTAAEYRAAQKHGWEKQYPYKVGKKKEYMTLSEATARGLTDRASKHPKSTKYGRQNPISARWNSFCPGGVRGLIPSIGRWNEMVTTPGSTTEAFPSKALTSSLPSMKGLLPA